MKRLRSSTDDENEDEDEDDINPEKKPRIPSGPFSSLLNLLPGLFSSALSSELKQPYNKSDEESEEEGEEESEEEEINTENAVLLIGTHGSILYDENGKFDTFEIPEGIEILKINKSAFGCINYDNDENIKRYDELIQQFWNELVDPFKSVNKIAINKIINEMRDDYNISIKSLKYHNKHKTKKLNTKTWRFMTNKHNGLNLQHLKPGDEVMNRMYTKYLGPNIELKKNDDAMFMKEYYMDQMNENILTDLGSESDLDNNGENNNVTWLNFIVDYYKILGVKKLIIFDTSCSSFGAQHNFRFTDKDIRRIKKKNRKTVKYGGKKIRTRKYKSKK